MNYPFVDMNQYERDKDSLSFEYNYATRRMDLIREIAYDLRFHSLQPGQNRAQFQEYIREIPHVPLEDDGNGPNEINLNQYIDRVITQGRIDIGQNVDLNDTDTLNAYKNTIKAEQFFRILLQEPKLSLLINVFDRLRLSEDDLAALNVNDSFDTMPNFNPQYMVFLDRATGDTSVSYARDPNESIVCLMQSLTSPFKVFEMMQKPFRGTKEMFLHLVWDNYLKNESERDHNFSVFHVNRDYITILKQPTQGGETDRDLRYLKEAVDNEPDYNVLLWDKETESQPWIRELFKAGPNPLNAGVRQPRYRYIKPVVEKALQKSMKDGATEISNDLRQQNLQDFMGNSLVSKTLQWFVLCTKVNALTNHMRNNITPTRFRVSILDKNAERQDTWNLIKKLAPRSTAIVEPYTNSTFSEKLPTWLSVLESCGFNLRF